MCDSIAHTSLSPELLKAMANGSTRAYAQHTEILLQCRSCTKFSACALHLSSLCSVSLPTMSMSVGTDFQAVPAAFSANFIPRLSGTRPMLSRREIS